MTGSRF